MIILNMSGRECNGRRLRLLLFTAAAVVILGGRARAETTSMSKSTAAAPAVGDLKPAAMVTGRTWPVELTLRLLNTNLKRGEHPWYRISIRNTGTHDIVLRNDSLRDPSQLEGNFKMNYSIYLLVIDSNNKPVPWFYLETGIAFEVPGFEEDELIELERTTREELIKKGLPEPEVQERIASLRRFPPPVKIHPGDSYDSLPWAYNPFPVDDSPPKNPRAPLGSYTELPFFALSKPGDYRIKAVYDQTFPQPSPELKGRPIFPVLERLAKEHPDRPELGAVKVETPWIRFRVEP